MDIGSIDKVAPAAVSLHDVSVAAVAKNACSLSTRNAAPQIQVGAYADIDIDCYRIGGCQSFNWCQKKGSREYRRLGEGAPHRCLLTVRATYGPDKPS